MYETQSTNHRARWTRSLIAAAVVGAGAAPALACDELPEVSGDEPRRSAVYTYRYNLTGDEDAERVALSIVNGKISVSLNGESVPPERLREEDGRVVVLDEDGKELTSISVRASGTPWAVHLGDGWAGKDKLRVVEAQRAAAAGPPPKVMLGMLMAAPGPALEKQLKLEAGATTMVSGVHEGLPAHAAGLAEFDIITELNGAKPADAATIRKALQSASPGDTLTFNVISGGQARKVSVKLEGYDAKRMKQATILGKSQPADEFGALRNWADGEVLAQALGRLGRAEAGATVVAPDARTFLRVQPQADDAMKLKERIEQRMHGQNRQVEERLGQIDDRIARLEKLIEGLAANKAQR